MPATLSSKGQVTIPRQIREILNIKQGDAVDFIVEKGTVKLKGIPTGRARALAGSLKPYGKGKPSTHIRETTKERVARETVQEDIFS